MKSLQPSTILKNRANESSLQILYEEMLVVIKQLDLKTSEEKMLVGMLAKYRSTWNSYLNRLKPRENRAELRSRVNHFLESENQKNER